MRKKVILGFALLFIGISFSAWKYFQISALEKEKDQFSFIEKLNEELISKLPDSSTFEITGFNYTMKYEKEEYTNLLGKRTLDKIYDGIKNKIIYSILLRPNVYSTYTIKNEPLFIKDFRVTQYIYFKQGNFTRRKLKRLEIIYKLEKFEKVKDKWYKVIYIENSGRSFNL